MTKITLEQLEALIADPARADADLSDYFILDQEASGPFAPVFTFNPDTVDIPLGPDGQARSAQIMNMANRFERWRRTGRFYEKIRSGYDGPIIVSEGDSWFQYPIRLHDTIDKLMERYAILSLGAAGDLLERMARKQEYLKALRDTGASILLLSGGGNDLVANGALADYLEEFDVDLKPADYLKPEFQGLLDSAFGYYEQMCRQVQGAFPHVQILCHGYDYPIPNRGKWLGKPMETRGIRDRSLQKAIAAEMMDRFNRGMRRLAKSMPHVTYIDCRSVVGDGRWYDELHPENPGYADVAGKFDREIRRISNAAPRSLPHSRGPFGGASHLAAPAVVGRANKAMSLHVGLNSVDADHYAGWDGALNACENDAHAMANLAAGQGFEPELLLTRNATREAVVARLAAAAETLTEGDMFFWSFAGHGYKLPDFNRDEAPDAKGEHWDETLVLYDFQIIDDELFSLWSRFKPGVRILMVPDCCHSGTVIRAMFPEVDQPKMRMMPQAIGSRTFEQNEQAYRNYIDEFAHQRDDILHNPLSARVRASVLSLTACQDHQVAMDGHQNGAFTEALLKVWNKGRFSGNYVQFRTAVDRAIGSPDQTPNLYWTGAEDAGFRAQVPFTLWTNPSSTVLGGIAPPAPPKVVPVSAPPMSLADRMLATEGDEHDDLPDDVVTEIAEGRWRSPADPGTRSVASWPDAQDFFDFIKALGLRHFSPGEFLILGGSHNGTGPCAGKNSYPPRSLWPNIANTAQVLDELRDRIGKPTVITNAYRAPAYNTCIGGATGSQHKQFNALDFKVPGVSTRDIAWALRQMRDDENRFKGGVGLYNSFVHVDTRGVNATWPPEFKNAASPAGTVLAPRHADLSPKDRRAMIEAIDLAPIQGRLPRVRSAFRSPETADEETALALEKQKLNAAVNASSVVSFVENLTPQQKDDVLLSTLFAQRAASAKKDPVKEIQAWLTVYLDTLSLLGWSVESAPQMQQQTLKANATFDEAILKILAVVASQSQFAILQEALGALGKLADNSGQIKLFDRSTSVTEGGHFQVGAAEASGEVVSMALGAFHYRWTDEQKNVLFVKWGKNEVKYWMAAQRASLSGRQYADIRDQVSERLGASRKKLIANIDLD
ncbi:caspase family protein [Aliisedimentitalea scapharcae]|uniref:Caspase family protein n=1 Tax=Aliisedimentitalea scapharcae TaxID=1524259 RepID=A0ABZ2XQ89_9RHOB